MNKTEILNKKKNSSQTSETNVLHDSQEIEICQTLLGPPPGPCCFLKQMVKVAQQGAPHFPELISQGFIPVVNHKTVEFPHSL